MTLGELKKILTEQMEKVDSAITEWGENEKVQNFEMTGDCFGDCLLEIHTGDEEKDGVVDFDELVDTSVED